MICRASLMNKRLDSRLRGNDVGGIVDCRLSIVDWRMRFGLRGEIPAYAGMTWEGLLIADCRLLIGGCGLVCGGRFPPTRE